MYQSVAVLEPPPEQAAGLDDWTGDAASPAVPWFAAARRIAKRSKAAPWRCPGKNGVMPEANQNERVLLSI